MVRKYLDSPPGVLCSLCPGFEISECFCPNMSLSDVTFLEDGGAWQVEFLGPCVCAVTGCSQRF